MKKHISLLIIVMIISSVIGTNSFAKNEINATTTQSNIVLDGNNIYCMGFNILDNNYFMLRDLAENLSGSTSQFDVIWNGEKNRIEIVTGKVYTAVDSKNTKSYYSDRKYSANPTNSEIFIDGQVQSVIAYNIDGNNYFKLRDLGDLIPFDVTWDDQANEIRIFSQVPQNGYRAEMAFTAKDNKLSPFFPRWRSTITTYLINNNDQTKSVIEAKDKVSIETYDEQHHLIENKSIEYELPIFGGFYSGEKYNYMAFGQGNSEENDNKEVIRVVRYDKNFKRIDSVSINGGESYTFNPFDAGSGRMAEYGNTLIFHTSRKRYTTEDGKNHQSQLTIIIDTASMKVTNDLGKFQSNHVSHSFDQYVQYDGNSHVLVDHGDAYPRSVVLSKQNGERYTTINLFEIPGKIGANCTGVSIGGFEISSENYLVAINSIDHSLVSEYTSFEMIGLEIDQRDIIICASAKNTTRDSDVKQVTLAKYVGSDKLASIPQLVKITEEKLMVLWQEYDKKGSIGDLKYVFIDQKGNATSEIKAMKYYKLSTSKPIIMDNVVTWYINENGNRVFYSIPLN